MLLRSSKFPFDLEGFELNFPHNRRLGLDRPFTEDGPSGPKSLLKESVHYRPATLEVQWKLAMAVTVSIPEITKTGQFDRGAIANQMDCFLQIASIRRLDILPCPSCYGTLKDSRTVARTKFLYSST